METRGEIGWVLAVAAIAVALALTGCSGEGPIMVLPDVSVATDGGVPIVADDAALPQDDASAPIDDDAGRQADAGEDPVDAGSDAGTPVGTDAGSDGGVDGGQDAGTDAGTDAGVDGGSDAGSTTVQVAAGETHTCARRSDGTVSCWGSPGAALGYGGSANWPIPKTVSGVSDAEDISAGGTHTCAVRAMGRVSCWGLNDVGQVGNGSTSMWELTPQGVSGVTAAVQVALGAEHSCALNDGVTVDMGQCWGRNQHDQVGNTSAGLTAPSPFWVDGFSDGIEIGARGDRTCVRRSGNLISCWGDSMPLTTEPLTGSAIAVGQEHLCTIRPVGGVQRPSCWGDNTYGQLTVSVATWAVDGLQVVAGNHHSCALFADGSVWCWGRNHRGQVGSGSSASMVGTATQIISNGATDLSAGADHTCAVVDGGVKCWGDNSGGQLGTGATTGLSSTPVDVVGL